MSNFILMYLVVIIYYLFTNYPKKPKIYNNQSKTNINKRVIKRYNRN